MQVYDLTREFQGHFAAVRSSTRFLVVHHAAADYPPYFGRDDVAAIANYHISKGWAGVGYHEILAQETNGGPIAAYIVSRPDTVRAHIAGRNHECFGICMAANFSRSTPPQQWLDALALRLVAAKRRFPNAQIFGHRELALKGHETACPGEKWAAWRPGLLAQVEAMLKQLPVITRKYRAKSCAPVFQDRRPDAPLALTVSAGQIEVMDDLTNGWLHFENHAGFSPVSCWELL